MTGPGGHAPGGHAPGSFGALLSRRAGGELGDDVQVADVPGVLLEQVEQDPLEGGRVGAVPPLTGLAHLVEPVRLDDGPAPRTLGAQVGQQRGGGFLRPDRPAVTLAVTPRVTDVASLETPFQPAQPDVAQVLDQP